MKEQNAANLPDNAEAGFMASCMAAKTKTEHSREVWYDKTEMIHLDPEDSVTETFEKISFVLNFC